jgi:hypothetical protein
MRTDVLRNELKRRRDHTVTDESLLKTLARVHGLDPVLLLNEWLGIRRAFISQTCATSRERP